MGLSVGYQSELRIGAERDIVARAEKQEKSISILPSVETNQHNKNLITIKARGLPSYKKLLNFSCHNFVERKKKER